MAIETAIANTLAQRESKAKQKNPLFGSKIKSTPSLTSPRE
jgi:hypothetical protein